MTDRGCIVSRHFCTMLAKALPQRRQETQNFPKDGNKMSHADSKMVSSADKLHQEASDMAERIRKDQGYFEVEVSCGGESDLHRAFIMCDKNPGHTNFVPACDFKMEHLPARYHDNVLVDWIRSKSDTTVRISAGYISQHRPETFPESDRPFPFYHFKGGNCLRTGTGWLGRVDKFARADNKSCECEACRKLDVEAREKVWGRVFVITAAHVIFDVTESRCTTCHFFYDKSNADLNSLVKLHGLEVEDSDTKGDYCLMRYATHDMGLIDRLDKVVSRYLFLCHRVRDMMRCWRDKTCGPGFPGPTCDIDPEHKLSIIISHPHGCSKQISVGEWTRRVTVRSDEKIELTDGSDAVGVVTQYVYNTPTCPGSSGAPVFTLVKGWWWWWFNHPHCQGHPDEGNSSGFRWEPVKSPWK